MGVHPKGFNVWCWEDQLADYYGEGELEQTGFGLEIAFEMAPLLTLNASFVLVQSARPTVPRRRDSICPP